MIEKIFMELVASKVIEAVVLLIVFDTIFGIIRAIKEHSFNSSVGIDGAIRKVSMLVSLVGLQIADFITGFNLIGFIPKEIRAYLPLEVIGLAEFFGLIYCSYEVVSVLKNMALCGLPVRKLWEAVQKFLSKYTKELPCMDDMDEEEIDVEEIEETEE
jgi:toxin secretion/phage lysis holin